MQYVQWWTITTTFSFSFSSSLSSFFLLLQLLQQQQQLRKLLLLTRYHRWYWRWRELMKVKRRRTVKNGASGGDKWNRGHCVWCASNRPATTVAECWRAQLIKDKTDWLTDFTTLLAIVERVTVIGLNWGRLIKLYSSVKVFAAFTLTGH